jgi:hypothetical protein
LGESNGDSQKKDEGDEDRERFELLTEKLLERRWTGATGLEDIPELSRPGCPISAMAPPSPLSSVKLLVVESKTRRVR